MLRQTAATTPISREEGSPGEASPGILATPKQPLLASVQGRIVSGFGLLVIILVAIVGGSLWLLNELDSALHEIGENLEVTELLQRAEHEHTQGILLLESYFAGGDEELVPEIRSSFSEARESIIQALIIEETETGFTGGVDADGEVARLNDVLAAMSSSGVIIDEAIVRFEGGDHTGAEEALAVAFPQIIRLSADISDGIEDELTEVSFLQDQSDDLSVVGFWVLLTAGAVGITISVIAAFVIARSILKPLASLQSAALAVAGGKLEARAPVGGPRELAHLGASLNQMTESLLDASKRRELEEEREQAHAQLRRSNAELEDFTYVVSHDLKEPLRGIQAFSAFLGEDYADRLDDRGRHYTTVIRESAVRMKNLIEDLLRLSRIGRTEQQYTTVEAKSLITEAQRDLEFALQEKRVDLRVQGDFPTITCEETSIKEVFKNLISNAIKFSDKPRPIVEISYRQDAGAHVFSVRDEGIGIEERYRDKIFQIFQRLNKREDYEGSGAGLAICRKIVASHGGSIWVDSEVGQGSTFSFTIPNSVRQA